MTAMYKFCWAMWIAGTLLIVASWTNAVTPTVGWLGFAIAMIGTLLSSGAQSHPTMVQQNPPIENQQDPPPGV